VKSLRRISHLLRYLLLIILFSLLLTNAIYAANNNVEDCFNEKNDCEQFDQIRDSDSSNQSNTDDDSESSDDPMITGNTDDGPSLFVSFLQMILALLLVLGLIYVMLKFVNRRQQLFQQTQSLENLGGISVGQNKSIQVIRVGSKMYLIGVGDNVELLKEIDDDELKENLSNIRKSAPLSFKQWAKSLIPTKNKREVTREQNSFNNILANELDQMKGHRKQMIEQFEKKEDTHE